MIDLNSRNFMTSTQFSDSAFFGYKNLPDSLEFDGVKLVPIKKIKIKCEKNKMSTYTSGGTWIIRRLCESVGAKIYRPIKGLFCVEEKYAEFIYFICEKLNSYQTGYTMKTYSYLEEKQNISILFEEFVLNKKTND